MLIFVASTGRCGTYFMSEVMRKLTSIPSFHEPPPYGSGETLRLANSSPDDLSDEQREKFKLACQAKLTQIRLSIRDGWYFESNQMFAKTWWPTIIKYCIEKDLEIGVIYLNRNPRDTMRSWVKKTPNFETDWHLDPESAGSFIKTGIKNMSFCEMLTWEWYEIRERYKQRIAAQTPRNMEIEFEDLNLPTTWRKIFDYFGIPHMHFNELPEVGRNEKIMDPGALENLIARGWREPGKFYGYDPVYKRTGAHHIDTAKKIIAMNSAEMNACKKHQS